MKFLSFLIKPASSLCNLKCKYCFYNDISNQRKTPSFGVMNDETMKNLITKALSYHEETMVTFAFQGGEPTMAGLTFFETFAKMVDQYKKDYHHVTYSIQTNGILLDEKWVSLFKKYHFLVGISLDGYRENHDFYRLDLKENPTFKKVLDNIRLLEKNQIEYNVLTVLTASLAKHPQKLYKFYKQQKLNYVQLIPCLPKLNQTVQEDEYALTPQLFASFYKSFYKLWEADLKLGNVMSVSLFDNIIPMYQSIPPQVCGMLGFCSPQYVVESDGSIYPCDFYVLDEYCIGNINENTLGELAKNKLLDQFLKEEKRESPLCQKCAFVEICHGNCKRMNISYFDDHYCGYQDFLKETYPSMIKIARQLG
ncbi:MAG: anaerobic sulfatase maturase [Erysipelotrichaceae bacterium]|nr:anaerobic sulfatase maturase [Erysipelotrichaceae bacterium]